MDFEHRDAAAVVRADVQVIEEVRRLWTDDAELLSDFPDRSLPVGFSDADDAADSDSAFSDLCASRTAAMPRPARVTCASRLAKSCLGLARGLICRRRSSRSFALRSCSAVITISR